MPILVPITMQTIELLTSIATLEATVSKLEENMVSLQFQLSQERNERRLAEYHLQHSFSKKTSSPSRKVSALKLCKLCIPVMFPSNSLRFLFNFCLKLLYLGFWYSVCIFTRWYSLHSDGGELESMMEIVLLSLMLELIVHSTLLLQISTCSF